MADAKPEAAAPGLDDAALRVRLEEARTIVGAAAHRTPALRSRTLDARLGAKVFLKCEALQRGGAFKFRGAWHFLSRLAPGTRARGVIAFSSGNHGQAVALAAQMHGIPAVVVMPSTAPGVKIDATRDYGAEIVFHDRVGESREALARRLADERGLTLVPPFDHADILTGQGTAAIELFEDVGPLDLLVVPLGGGGLLSGCALAAAALVPSCRVIGAEPAGADDGVRSFRSGMLERCEHPETIADGARTPSVGVLPFAIIRRHVRDIVPVPDAALVGAMRFAWERLKVVVEPTGVLALAALLSGHVACPPGGRVGLILSGGNVDLTDALRQFEVT